MNKDKQYLSVVNGNDFTLNMHVTRWNADNQSFIDYRMDNCSQVVCFLVAVTGGRRYKIPVTIDGNILTAEIDGSMLNVGVYGLELLFEDAESKSKRSYEPALLKIVRTNAEATYSQADFDSEDDCRLHITVQTNASFITIGSPTADAQIDATSYNAVSNSAVADAINNLQTQIDNIGADILDPSSVYTKAETEALVDTMIDTQEMEEYVSTALSSYTTTEQFNSSVNDLNTRITAIEESPVDLSSYVSKEELSQQGYITESDVAKMGYITAGDVSSMGYITTQDVSSMGYITTQDVSSMGYATTQFVTEQIEAIPAIDLSSYVSKEELSQQGYITAGDITSMGYVTANDVSSMGYVTAQDVSAMGYATTQFVTEQIAAIPQPDLSTYITETELNDTLTSYAKLTDLISNERVVSTALNSLADRIEAVEGDYVSDTELDETLLSYATKNYVDNKIDELAPSDLNNYVSKQFLSQQGYVTANDVTSMGYITAQDVSAMGYATTQYVTDQIANIPATDLSSYVSKSELNAAGYITESDVAQMGYITANDVSAMGYLTANDVSAMGYITETALDTALSSYVTTTNLNTTLSSYAKVSDIEDNEQVISTALNTLSDRIGLIENDYVSDDDLENFATKNYVDNKIDELAPSDLNEYVSKNYLSQQGYITAGDVSSMGYITVQDVSAMGYATTQYVTDQIANIPATDLSSYVSKSELNAAGYITESEVAQMGYVTANDVSAMGYITTQDVSSMGYATTQYVTDQIANIPDPDLSSYVSKSELNAASYITESDVSAMGYVTAQDVSAMGYLTANDISAMGYVTTTELSSASYVTNTALNTTLASYTTKADVPYKFVVMSYADYTALATKDPNTFYCIPEE